MDDLWRWSVTEVLLYVYIYVKSSGAGSSCRLRKMGVGSRIGLVQAGPTLQTVVVDFEQHPSPVAGVGLAPPTGSTGSRAVSTLLTQ